MGTLCLHMGVGTYQSKGFFAYDQEENNVYRAGHNPGDGIGNIQIFRGAVHLEDGEDPDNTKAAGTDEGDDHGAHRVTKAAQAAYHGVHDTAQSVGSGDVAKTDDALLDDVLLARGINAYQTDRQGCPVPHR